MRRRLYVAMATGGHRDCQGGTLCGEWCEWCGVVSVWVDGCGVGVCGWCGVGVNSVLDFYIIY